MAHRRLKPRFCELCGAASLVETERGTAFTCRVCSRTTYRGSKPSVCAVILWPHHKVVLVRERSSRAKWDLPGGFLRYGEQPLEGLRRELREEIGVEPLESRLFGAIADRYGGQPGYSLNLFYHVVLRDGQPRPRGEIGACRAFPLARLPKLKFASTEAALCQVRSALAQGERHGI